MCSTNNIFEEDTSDTSINKTGCITNLMFVVIETTGTPEKIYIDQTERFSVTSIKVTK